MDRDLLSDRRRPEPAGFSLLECLVALLILGGSVLGVLRLVLAHQAVLVDAEAWALGEPDYYLAPVPDELQRTLGRPAHLAATPPAVTPPSSPPMQTVTVLKVVLGLDPPSASATVRVESP